MITRATFEGVLNNRAGRFLSRCGMTVDPYADASPRAYMNDAAGVALRKMGYAVADDSNVSDVDLASVPDGRKDELYDRGELRLFEDILGWLADPDVQIKMHRQDWHYLRDSLERTQARKQELVVSRYDSGANRAYVGTIKPVVGQAFGSNFAPKTYGTTQILP